MKVIDYIVYYGLICGGYAIGILPLFVQYILSDILRFFVYNIFRYRVKVVRINLSRSFPLKSTEELRKIERDFYKHFVDVMLESLTLISLNSKRAKRRLVYKNHEVVNKLAEERSVIAAMAHVGAWEYTINYSLFINQPVLAVYHTLKSKGVERFYVKMRSKFGVEPTAMQYVGRQIAKRNDDRIVVALIADQNPPRVKQEHWINFLNQKTHFFKGMETFALRYNMGVAYLEVTKVKRGFYEGRFILIYNGVDKISSGEITEKYAQLLEKSIETNPSQWLWTHKRWKQQPDGGSIY